MKITSTYSIFSTSDMNKIKKYLEESKELSVLHHIENDEFDYYVMEDNSGFRTDIIQHKKMQLPEGFFAVRKNVDNYEEYANILTRDNYELEGNIFETESMKMGLYVSKEGKPNIYIVEHKKK